MNMAVLHTDYYQNNRIFDLNDVLSNRDDCLYHYSLLRERLASQGISLATQDMSNVAEAQFAIYNEMPDLRDKSVLLNQNSFLILWESELVSPENWASDNHEYFKKIFTWNDQFVDGERYIKYFWPNKIPAGLDFDVTKKSKFCTMIAGNKMVEHPLELYRERISAIRWFERQHPDEFDLYGTKWDEYVFRGNIIARGLNRIKPLTRALRPHYPSYRGAIQSKAQVLNAYKFAICYENARDIPGYITEKIFDCFFAGCIPIYLGAPNITKFIPASTFIDRRNFRGYDDLYEYAKSMSISEYQGYLSAIETFIQSDAMYLFSAENFADTLIAEITKSLA